MESLIQKVVFLYKKLLDMFSTLCLNGIDQAVLLINLHLADIYE